MSDFDFLFLIKALIKLKMLYYSEQLDILLLGVGGKRKGVLHWGFDCTYHGLDHYHYVTVHCKSLTTDLFTLRYNRQLRNFLKSCK